MESSDPKLRARAIALMEWEASCEHIRRALHPPVGYPTLSPLEVDAAFAAAAEKLHILRTVVTIPEE